MADDIGTVKVEPSANRNGSFSPAMSYYIPPHVNASGGEGARRSAIRRRPTVQIPVPTSSNPPANITQPTSRSPTDRSTPPRVPSPVAPRPTHDRRQLSTITELTEFSTPPSRPLSPLPLSTPPQVSAPLAQLGVVTGDPGPSQRRYSPRSPSPSRRSRSPTRKLSPPGTMVPAPISPSRDHRRRSRSRSSSPSPQRHHRSRYSPSPPPIQRAPTTIVIQPARSPPSSPDVPVASKRVHYPTQVATSIPQSPYYYDPYPPQPPVIVVEPPRSRSRRRPSRRRSSTINSARHSSRSPERLDRPSQTPQYGYPIEQQDPYTYTPNTPLLPPQQTYGPYYSGSQYMTHPPPTVVHVAPPSPSTSSDEREENRQSTIRHWRDASSSAPESAPESPYTSRFHGDDEWRQYIHPNGSVYWASFGNAVVSDEQPHNGSIMLVEPQLGSIRGEVDSEQWELYVTAGSSRFVHHASRSASRSSEMFHVFKARMEQAVADIMTKLDLEYQYWTYVQGHPNHINLSPEAKYDAEEAILWAHADRSLFDSSNAPFEKEVAKEMFSILREIDALARITLKVWFIAAVMRAVVEERRACQYGTSEARKFRYLEKAEEVAGIQKFTSIRKALAWRLIAAMTLGAPYSYLKRIINVDRSNGISTSRWRAFLRNLCAEWVDTNLLSTVLVSATTAMLAISGLNPLAQVSAFGSILCSLGSVLCGMLLIFTHRGRLESTGRAAYLYFDYAKRLTGSPHSLAVLLSLPLSLTLWSIFWFVLSVTSLAFKPTVSLSPSIWGLLLRYGTLSLVGCLVLAVAVVGWFFRSRQEGAAPAPVERLVPPPPPYMPYPMPVFAPTPMYSGYGGQYNPTPIVNAVYNRSRSNSFQATPIPYRTSEVTTATPRRRHHSYSGASTVAAATFRPHSV